MFHSPFQMHSWNLLFSTRAPQASILVSTTRSLHTLRGPALIPPSTVTSRCNHNQYVDANVLVWSCVCVLLCGIDARWCAIFTFTEHVSASLSLSLHLILHTAVSCAVVLQCNSPSSFTRGPQTSFTTTRVAVWGLHKSAVVHVSEHSLKHMSEQWLFLLASPIWSYKGPDTNTQLSDPEEDSVIHIFLHRACFDPTDEFVTLLFSLFCWTNFIVSLSHTRSICWSEACLKARS